MPESPLVSPTFPSLPSKKSALAIIGGGRWGRVILSVLTQKSFWKTLLPEPSEPSEPLCFDSLVVVCKTQSNIEIIEKCLASLDHALPFNIAIVPSLDVVLTNYDVMAAFVVNSARQHYDTALKLLEHQIPIFVEKPIALTVFEVNHLLQKMQEQKKQENKLFMLPGFIYKYCKYLYHFLDKISELNSEIPVHFTIEWRDAMQETRYGEKKSFDGSLDIAQDVMSHIWTIHSILFPNTRPKLGSCKIKNLGNCADFEVENGRFPGTISLERNATERTRKCTVVFKTGKVCALDFSTEPGTICVAANAKNVENEKFSGDPHWQNQPSPMMKQLSYFLRLYQGLENYDADQEAACRESVIFTEKASELLQEAQATLLQQMVRAQQLNVSHVHALQSYMASDLISEGLMEAGDHHKLNQLIDAALQMIIEKTQIEGNQEATGIGTTGIGITGIKNLDHASKLSSLLKKKGLIA